APSEPSGSIGGADARGEGQALGQRGGEVQGAGQGAEEVDERQALGGGDAEGGAERFREGEEEPRQAAGGQVGIGPEEAAAAEGPGDEGDGGDQAEGGGVGDVGDEVPGAFEATGEEVHGVVGHAPAGQDQRHHDGGSDDDALDQRRAFHGEA